MQHRKLDRLMTPVERIARVAAAGLTSATSSATKPSGAKSYDNADGTRTIIGNVANGESNPSYTMATHVGDVTAPGTPTGVTATSKSGVVVVEWDGTLSGGIPDDFFAVRVYLDGSELGILTGAGSVSSASLEGGTTHSVTATAEDDACLPDGTPAHNVSAATTAISVTVSEGVESVAAEVEQVRQDVADFRDDVATTYATKVEREDGDDAVKTWVTTNYTNSNDLATTYATKTLVSQTKDAIELAASQTYETQSDAAATYATKSALTVGLNGIRTEVAEDYQPKGDYATTASMNSAIQQSASSIESTVAATYLKQSDASTTYATKTEVQQTASGLDTRITTAQSTADGAYLERSGTGTTIDTTGAATIRSLVVEGQSVQDGTPTPSAPVPIVSVESRNLLVQPYVNASKTQNGVTFTVNDDYSLTVSGTSTATTYFNFATHTSSPYEIEPGTYTLGLGTALPTGMSVTTNRRVGSSNLESFTINAGSSSKTGTFSASGILRCYVVVQSGATIDTTIYPMLERGTTANPYQPYGCVTLVAGNSRTDIDLQGHALRSLPDGTEDVLVIDSEGNKTLTKRVGAVDMGTLTWGYNANGYFYAAVAGKAYGNYNIMCTDYAVTSSDSAAGMSNGEIKGHLTSANVFAKNSVYSDAASFKAAVNGILLWYELATPQEIDLGKIDLPAPADTLWLDAAIVPTIEATWWTVDGIAGQQALDAEVTERQTLIRQFSGGVLAGYVGNAIAALVNAAGSFDVVQTTWSNGVPSITDTLARYAANLVELGRNSTTSVIEFCGGIADLAYRGTSAILRSKTGSVGIQSGTLDLYSTTQAALIASTLATVNDGSVQIQLGSAKPRLYAIADSVYLADTSDPYTLNKEVDMYSLIKATNCRSEGVVTLWAGTKVMNVGTNVSSFTLFTKAQLQAIVGTNWTPTGANCAVFVMNGDYGATDAMMSASIDSSSVVRVHMNKTKTGDTRINYLIVRIGG